MIEVTGLTKTYGDRPAIHDLNFTVKKGEVVGFLGPNGAGKSTTMKIITGFMAPTSGLARVAGFDVFEEPIQVKKRIGYLPETPPVYGDMRVRDYLEFVADLKGVDSKNRKKWVDQAIDKTSLGQVSARLIQNLSKGFRQRVGIAQALVSNPEVLILDEPTVGLDPKQVAEIRSLISELRGQHTIILSTHVLPEVQATCERIIIINKGQIVAQDSLENLSALQNGGRRVNLKIKRAHPEFQNRLQKLRGVIRVSTTDNGSQWILDTEGDDLVIEAIAQEALSSGLGLMEIGSAKADLEDIFLKLTYGQKEVSV